MNQKGNDPGSKGTKPAALQMQITGEGISFPGLAEFKSFVQDFDLMGQVKLARPIVDKNGNILYKENLYLKETILLKLEEMEGQFQPDFLVSITDELLKSLRDRLTGKFLERLELPENKFVAKLYENTRHRFKSYIRNAFHTNRSLILTFFKLSREKPQLFNHLGDMGLLTLGVLIQKAYRIRFIHLFAFLSGVLSDLGTAGSSEWRRYPEDEGGRMAQAARCAGVAEKFHVAPEIIDAIKNHPVLASHPDANHRELPPDESENQDFSYEDLLEGDESQEGGWAALTAERNEMAAMVLTEALRIARYIDDTARRIEDREHFAEELVYMVAYNAARGYFHDDLIQPILKRFKEYEQNARRLMLIAEVEKRCLYPPSAWAYPKPRATQILCKNHVVECPNMVQGWDIHVISPQEALGWIGASLAPGNYSKCSLESFLESELPGIKE